MASAETAPLAAFESEVTGHVDAVEAGELVGWAYAQRQSDTPVKVGLRAGDRMIGSGEANLFRQDLKQAGIGLGYHGFRIAVEIPFFSGQRVDVELVDLDRGKAIAAAPFVLNCRDPHALSLQELDAWGVHGLVPPKKNKRQRQLDAVIAPVLRPIRKLSRHYQRKSGLGLAPGVQAKLSRVDRLSVTAVDSIGNWPKLTLPEAEAHGCEGSLVSVIIPVYNQFQLTYQCLTSLILSGDKTRFEVIVIDDQSTDATCVIEQNVENLRVLRNTGNLGFLHSCNKGAAAANGDYLVFLNNDTEVKPGWLDELLDVFNRFDNVGAAGAKLVYPNGRLQDAGGIVWSSGTPWNVGHGKDPDDPEYNYVREVDYLTGAALMVERTAWNVVGGFSEGYAPAYYEDTDLSFKLRAAGYRTLYCPQATVVHYEGKSNGTDLSSGIKRHQVINANLFKSTWKHAFANQGAEGVNLRRHKDRNRGLRVLMVDNAFPRLGQDAGSYAAIQELKMLQALGCKITFLPNNLLHLGVHVDYLQRLGVECVHAPFHRSVSKFLESRAEEFDVVYITRYVVAEKIVPLVRQYSSARIVFNNADLHFLREIRSAWVNGVTDLSGPYATRERELNVMRSADALLSYSDVEAEIIASHLMRRDNLFKCPWVLYPQREGKPFAERQGLAFLGGFAHPPNRDAMNWFLKNVLPALREKFPQLQIHIWGSHIPEDTCWRTTPGVVLEGYADSLDQVFADCKVFVAPLQAGAGIKGKVLDSLAYGVPTVLSPVACEATGLIDEVSTLVATTPEQWTGCIERLLGNSDQWNRIKDNANRLRDEHYSFDTGTRAMGKVLDYLGLEAGIPDQQVNTQ